MAFDAVPRETPNSYYHWTRNHTSFPVKTRLFRTDVKSVDRVLHQRTPIVSRNTVKILNLKRDHVLMCNK